MVSVTVELGYHEFEALKKLADEKFPFFGYLDSEEKVKALIEYLVERMVMLSEVASNGYEG